MHRKLLLTTLLALLATVSHAQSLAVATLLPPPDLASLPATQATVATVQVPVLKQPVQKGETITAENVISKSIPASQAFASTITGAEELIGQQAVRPLGASQPINRLHVRVAALVMRNQGVTLVFRRGGVELSGRGQALEDGQLGQSVRVLNPTTRSTVVGTVAAGGIVEIN